MSGGKSTEGFPVVDFTLSSRRPIDRSSEVPCGGFTFQPQIDSVAADMECLTRFALSHAIEFDRLNDFFTEVIAIRIGHRRHPHKLSLHLYRHVLVVLATAINRAISTVSQKTQPNPALGRFRRNRCWGLSVCQLH